MTPVIDGFVILSVMTLGLAVFFGVFAVAHTKSDIRNLFLGGIILVIIFNIYHETLVHSRLLIEFPMVWGYGGTLNPFIYVLGYYFVKFKDTDRFEKKDLLHLSLPGIYLLFRIHRNLTNPHDINQLIRYYESSAIPTMSFNLDLIWDIGMNVLFSMIYLYISLGINKHHRLKDNYSLVVLLFISIQLWVTLMMLGKNLFQWHISEWSIAIGALSVQTVFIGLFIVKLPLITASGVRSAIRYQGSRLSLEAVENYRKQLESAMAEKDHFTRPDLSLKELSNLMHVNPTYLSQVINQSMGLGFSEYINKLRILKAKELLANVKYDKYTLEAIGYEVGFSSKSSFYRAFHKVTGQTPHQYKKSIST